MKKIYLSALVAIACVSCSRQQYVVSNITAQRFAVVKNDSFPANEKVHNLVVAYKSQLDSEMNQVIGTSDMDMPYGRGESLLTNLTSDVMLEYARKNFDPACGLSFMNVYGHRSNLGKGPITVGNVFEVYSFENTLAMVKVKGSDLMGVFESYARMGGAGLSSNIHLVIKDGKLLSVSIDGKPVDKDKVYSLVTLDYLAEGNDGMDALKNSLESVDTGVLLRDVMMGYVKEQTREGHSVKSKLDGRITIQK